MQNAINKYLKGPSIEEIKERITKSDHDHSRVTIKAAHYGYLKLFKELWEEMQTDNDEVKGYVLVESIKEAIRWGNLNILKYIHGEHIIEPWFYELSWTIKNRQTHILKYLIENYNLNIDLKAYKQLYEESAIVHHYESAKYLSDKINELNI